MGRIHGIELHDQQWFPRSWRDALTAFLRFAADVSGQAARVADKVAEVVHETHSSRIVDLCAGGGGPTPAVVKALAAKGVAIEVRATDLHPNLGAFEAMARESGGRITYERESVDAMNVPAHLGGLRTVFNAFHHFQPDEARAILAAAVRDRQPIVVVELVGRTAPAMVGMLFTPLFMLASTIVARPVRWDALFFSWIVPVLPAVACFDGIVSCLRVYSEEELKALVAGIEARGWSWETGKIPLGGPIHATYLVGRPR